MTRDVDSKGRADDSFALVYVRTDGELAKHWIVKSDAMKLAKRIGARDSIDWTAEGTAYEDKPKPAAELTPEVAAALAQATEAIRAEREEHTAKLDALCSHVTGAAQLHASGDIAGAHASVAKALDLAFDALGECNAIEPLAALIGYVDPDPTAAETEGGAPSTPCRS